MKYPIVEEFAVLMDAVMTAHAKDLGESWKQLSTAYLLKQMRKKVEDLTWSITGTDSTNLNYACDERLVATPSLTRAACLHIANYAMMIYANTQEKK
jgi:hypothetical protein